MTWIDVLKYIVCSLWTMLLVSSVIKVYWKERGWVEKGIQK